MMPLCKSKRFKVKNLTMFFLLLVLLNSCSDNENQYEQDFIFITDVEVISHNAIGVEVDNFRKTIEILLEAKEDLSSVELLLKLADKVEMIQPLTTNAVYDLNNNPKVVLDKNGRKVEFKIITHFNSTSSDISLEDWEKKNSFGDLPDYISIYAYKKDISGKNVNAFIAVADISPNNGKFRILGNKTGYQSPTQFFNQNNKPPIILNGGYFWDGNSLGLMIRGGTTIKSAQPVTWRSYNGSNTAYYPTQGIFGLDSDGKFYAHWAYESNGKLYTYPSPSPNIAGEKPQEIPSDIFPTGAKHWTPKEAIGAGPLLIKNGEYKNLWENELFDASSGVGPTINHPRSAISYHPKGYLVFFVCEGRNQTPNTPGLTLKNVADILLDLGCTEAINLDGGGSSCMLVNGKETIKPSDGKQRIITNAVAIF